MMAGANSCLLSNAWRFNSASTLWNYGPSFSFITRNSATFCCGEFEHLFLLFVAPMLLIGWPALFQQLAFGHAKLPLHFDLARHDGFHGKSFFNNRKTGSTAAPQSSDEMKSEGWMVFGDHVWFKFSCATWFFLILMFFDLYLKAAYGRMSYGIHVWSICYTIARYECKR